SPVAPPPGAAPGARPRAAGPAPPAAGPPRAAPIRPGIPDGYRAPTASPTATHKKVTQKSSVGGLIVKIALLLVLAGGFFGAWHYHTRIGPGKVVDGFLTAAAKHDFAEMRKYVTKASAKVLPGKDATDEEIAAAAAQIGVPKGCKFTIKSIDAGFSSGTVKTALTIEGVEGSWDIDWAVVREALSWKVNLQTQQASGEGGESE
ncbi:MAG: hypothetical protein ACE5JM_05485, partial [Armatimonadota bacterium]